MKKVIIAALLALFSIQLQAQIVSSRSSMITRETYDAPRNGWSTFGVEYLPSSFNHDGISSSFTGLAVNFTSAIGISSSTPLYIEGGLGGQYSFKTIDDTNLKFASIKLPLNLIYDFLIPNTQINIDPYAGLRLRFNVWGRAKEDRGDSYDIFSDEVGANRVQVGWSIGVKARFNNSFFVGIGYGADFNSFIDVEDWDETMKVKIHETSISVGLVF